MMVLALANAGGRRSTDHLCAGKPSLREAVDNGLHRTAMRWQCAQA